jgi:hypothetical protein
MELEFATKMSRGGEEASPRAENFEAVWGPNTDEK